MTFQHEHYRLGCWCIQCRKASRGEWVVRSKDRPSQAEWLARKAAV